MCKFINNLQIILQTINCHVFCYTFWAKKCYIITMDYSRIIILILGIFLYSIFYVLATFGYKLLAKRGKTFRFIFTISLIFGIIAYIIKIPLFYYYNLNKTLTTYILYIVILTITVVLYSKFILRENISRHTYIILLTIILLVMLNEYLSSKQQHKVAV